MSIFKKLRKVFSHPHPLEQPRYDVPVSAAALKEIFSECADFESRKIAVGGDSSGLVTICYIDGVIDSTAVSEDVIRPLTTPGRVPPGAGSARCMELIKRGAVYCNNVSLKETMDEVVEAVAKGFCLIIFDKENAALAFETRSSVQRSISEPTMEKAIKGSKDAFVERLRTNTMLVRRKLQTPKLKSIRTVIGRESGTELSVMYVDGIVDPVTVGELLKRLDDIDIDGLLAAGNLIEYISESPSTPFPQALLTERPDRFARLLLNGRVGLIVDGIPIAFLVPVSLPEYLRVPQEDSQNFLISSALSLVRWMAVVLALALPAFYAAIAMYHQEMIPSKLLLSIIQSKQDVPFSTALEITGMLIAFELLHEAGLRLPNPIGDTVSVIGALIVGQSAVEAKVISPIAVIVVATAGIAGYAQPSQDLGAALRLCRLALLIAAIIGGLYGVAAGLCLFVWYLCTIDSYGRNYTAPWSGGRPDNLSQTFLRKPPSADKLRETELNCPDRRKRS